MKLSSDTILYEAIPEHLCCDLNGESVILSLENGNYYGVNCVGAAIWEQVQKPASLERILAKIVDEYDVSEAEGRAEVQSFLNLMMQEGLIVTVYEKSAQIF